MTKDEALKLALDVLEIEEAQTHYPSQWLLKAITAIKEALAQPEQEPVGWLDSNDKLSEFMHKDLKAEHDKRDSSTPRAFQIPVYTTPPQRPSRSDIKPLTDEAIATVYWGATGQSLRPQDNVLAHNFARGIEAAHGIKENT